tara:strand:- start:2006 stop:2680 length:675 start_codon:yes stop_codon:yes gene_type:complete
MDFLREKVKTRLCDILNEELEMDDEDRKRWASEMEKGIFDTTVKLTGSSDFNKCVVIPNKLVIKGCNGRKRNSFPIKEEYLCLFRKVSSNISICPNKDSLIDRLCDGTVTPQELASMTHINLDPNNFQVERVKQLELDNENVSRTFKTGKGKGGIAIQIPYDILEEIQDDGTLVKKEVEVPDSMLVCGKCGMRKTSSYEMQTRSADEPMTIFANCLCCGNRWRM